VTERLKVEEGGGLLGHLGQFLPPEVEGDGLGVAGVVDLDVHLLVVLVLPDEGGLQTGHLVLLPVDQDLQRRTHTQWERSRFKISLDVFIAICNVKYDENLLPIRSCSILLNKF